MRRIPASQYPDVVLPQQALSETDGGVESQTSRDPVYQPSQMAVCVMITHAVIVQHGHLPDQVAKICIVAQKILGVRHDDIFQDALVPAFYGIHDMAEHMMVGPVDAIKVYGFPAKRFNEIVVKKTAGTL